MGSSKDLKKYQEQIKNLLEQLKQNQVDEDKQTKVIQALGLLIQNMLDGTSKPDEMRAIYDKLVEIGIFLPMPTTPTTPPTIPPTIPPVEPPAQGGGEKDQYGITKIYPDKGNGVLIPSTAFTEEEFTRNYASGAPSENSYECEYKDSNKLENEEVTYYVKINGFKNERDTISVKLLGNKHSDGSKDKWLIFQVDTDGTNEDNFQIEDPHPKNTDNHQKTLFTIGESLIGEAIGFKAITYIAEDGKRHAETWLDFPTDIDTPANNWRKYIDIPDVMQLKKGFLNATNGGALLRIDGTKKGSLPTTKFMSIREIAPTGEGGPTIPPTIPPVEPPVTPPPTTEGVIYDSNTIGKWNNGNARTITGMDPDCPKVFTGAGGLECHASGDPTLVLDGKGYGELQCKPGHGRFYVDVCNYNSILEYEVNFLDGSVENNTLNLRSRHQEGEPPANRMGGVQAKLDLKNYDFKTEIFHNEHENSSGDKPLPKPLSLNTWYKVKYTVKDVGTSLYQGMELDYGDGKGYVKVGEQTIKSPNKVYMEKDKILARSYFWIRMNNTKVAKLGIRNVKLTAL